MLADMKVCCENAAVANYENFWLATAAAAPVIALAAVVALPETSTITTKFLQRTVDDWFGNPARTRSMMLAAGAVGPALEVLSNIDFSDVRAKANKLRPIVLLRVIAAAIRWISICNVLLQATLLAFSLATLAYNVDVMPRWLAIVLTVSGIVLLAATVSLVSDYREAATTFSEMFENQMINQFKGLLASDEFKERLAAFETAPETVEEQAAQPIRSKLVLSLANLAKRSSSQLTALVKNHP